MLGAAPSSSISAGQPETNAQLGCASRTPLGWVAVHRRANLSLWPFKGVDGVRIIEVGGKHVANNAETA